MQNKVKAAIRLFRRETADQTSWSAEKKHKAGMALRALQSMDQPSACKSPVFVAMAQANVKAFLDS